MFFGSGRERERVWGVEFFWLGFAVFLVIIFLGEGSFLGEEGGGFGGVFLWVRRRREGLGGGWEREEFFF